jgi:hypothetical protein
MKLGPGSARLAAVYSMLAFALAPALAYSESEPEESHSPRMGGPQSIENELESDRAARDLDLYQLPYLNPYFDWKDQLADENGFAFGMDYTSAGRFATDSISGTDENAGGGIFRFFGAWDIAGRGTDTTGSLAYRFGHHHKYTDTAPQDMGLGNLRYRQLHLHRRTGQDRPPAPRPAPEQDAVPHRRTAAVQSSPRP